MYEHLSSKMFSTEIICDNCAKSLKFIPNDLIDLTFTSPPYYNARDYSTWPTYSEYLLFLDDIFVSIFKITKEGRLCVVNLSPVIVPRLKRSSESTRLPIPFHFLNIMEKIGWKYLDDIVWLKPEGASLNRNGGFFQHRQPVAYKPNLVTETIFVFQKPANFLIDKIVRSYKGKIKDESLVKDNNYERTNVWKINPETQSNHPAPFPLDLAKKVISYYSYVDDVVLDPFLGSGTTAVAAKLLNRKCIGIEIHQKYIDMTKKRLEANSNKIKED